MRQCVALTVGRWAGYSGCSRNSEEIAGIFCPIWALGDERMDLIQVSIERVFFCLLIILVGLLVYKLLFGFTALRVEDNFNLSVCTATRGHPYKLFLTRFTDVRKYFYCNRVVKIWNELPSDTVLHVLIHSSTDLLVVRACNFHLQSLRHLRPSLTFESAKSMSTAIIGARHQPPVQHYRAEPQPSQEGTERDTSATALSQQLHWLPIRQWITYKLATVTFKAKYCRTPPYLHEQLRDHQVARAL